MAISIGNTILTLEQLAEEGYVFRGQENSKWKLIPSAFREDSKA